MPEGEARGKREERNSISPMRQDLDRDEFRVIVSEASCLYVCLSVCLFVPFILSSLSPREGGREGGEAARPEDDLLLHYSSPIALLLKAAFVPSFAPHRTGREVLKSGIMMLLPLSPKSVGSSCTRIGAQNGPLSAFRWTFLPRRRPC